MKTPGLQNVFLRIHKEARDLTLNDLVDEKSRRKLVQQMSTVSSNLRGSIGERRKMRQELESMVDQKETETADNDENDGAGRLPAGFCTLTCPVYKWAQLHTTLLKSYSTHDKARMDAERCETGDAAKQKECFYKLAVANPGAVSWYCGLKLEMAVALTKALLSRQLQRQEVPGYHLAKEELRRELEEQLKEKMSVDLTVEDIPDLSDDSGVVDDYWASFEWSAGGMVHVHIALWIKGAPRIDKVTMPTADLLRAQGDVFELDGQVALEQGQAANRLASFFDRAYTECNLAKPAFILDSELNRGKANTIRNDFN